MEEENQKYLFFLFSVKFDRSFYWCKSFCLSDKSLYGEIPSLGGLNDAEEQKMSANREDNVFKQLEEVSIRRANPKLLSKVKEKHFDEYGKHNDAFDHQMLLGERSTEFDNLTKEEAGLRLGLIFDQMDVDNSTMVSEEELTNWIKAIAKERVDGRVNEFWARSNPSGNAINTTLDCIDRWKRRDKLGRVPQRAVRLP